MPFQRSYLSFRIFAAHFVCNPDWMDLVHSVGYLYDRQKNDENRCKERSRSNFQVTVDALIYSSNSLCLHTHFQNMLFSSLSFVEFSFI